MEGRVPLREFSIPGKPAELKVGDTVEVYLERIENALGEAVLSREKARREESWTRLEEKFNNKEQVEGVIFNKVKGGFTVDLDGAVAFLPGSQVDVRPVRDIGPLMHSPQPFKILKMDRRRGNIVVSRREVLEETRAEQRSEIVARLAEGQVIDGVVKNITDYGAFIDLGGIDGLLHVTDMAWRRVNHPSEIVNVGDTVKVQIVRINPETQRISLGMKQLQADPWAGIEAKYPVGARFKGTVTNIADYGAFVELEPGVEGLIHVSEMSWTKKNIHPGKIVSTSQQVDVQILEVDAQKRRISLGLKQTQDNPWDTFLASPSEGLRGRGPDPQHHRVRPVRRPRRRRRRHGAPLRPRLEQVGRRGHQGLQEGRQRQSRRARRRRAEGAHQPRHQAGRRRPARDRSASCKKGSQVTCEVLAVQDNGIEVKIADTDITTFIKRSDLSRDRSEQRPERFNVGDKVDAAVISLDKNSRRVTVSIKALEIAEEKQAVAQYGSSDSGASLGDIFKAAIKKKEGAEEKTGGTRRTGAAADCGAAGRSRGQRWRRAERRVPIAPPAGAELGTLAGVTMAQPMCNWHETRGLEIPMTFETETVLDRRRLRRRLSLWRGLAVLAALLAFGLRRLLVRRGRGPRRAAADRPRQPRGHHHRGPRQAQTAASSSPRASRSRR